MIKRSELVKDVYKLGDIASMIGVTTTTLRNWDKLGKLAFSRTSTGHRFLTRSDLIELLICEGLYFDDYNELKYDIVYARVSSHDQKEHGDLDRQVAMILQSEYVLNNVLVLSEVGSGLNDKRKKLMRLLDLVLDGKVNRVFVTYKDRLTRFGFNYLDKIFERNGVQIVVLNNSDSASTEQELVSDMMSLLASFSGKLYGMRSRKNRSSVKALLEDTAKQLEVEDVEESEDSVKVN